MSIDKTFDNEALDRLRDVERFIAVIQSDITNIKDGYKDIISCYKVLNEHHIDVEKDLSMVKINIIQTKNDLDEIKKFTKEVDKRFDKLEKNQAELVTSISAVKNTILTALTITSSILGVAVFVINYMLK